MATHNELSRSRVPDTETQNRTGANMKRAASVFIAVAAILSLCGCGKSEKSTEEAKVQPEAPSGAKWEPETAEQPKAAQVSPSAAESEKPESDGANAQAQSGTSRQQRTGPPKFQTSCPVDGGTPRRDCAVDRDGLRVFLCSTACSEEFSQSPGKYIEKLEQEGFTVAKIQQTCPVTGKAVDRDVYADLGGMRVYLCSRDCTATLARDPGKYVKAQMDEGVMYDFAPAGAHGGGPGHGHAH